MIRGKKSAFILRKVKCELYVAGLPRDPRMILLPRDCDQDDIEKLNGYRVCIIMTTLKNSTATAFVSFLCRSCTKSESTKTIDASFWSASTPLKNYRKSGQLVSNLEEGSLPTLHFWWSLISTGKSSRCGRTRSIR